MPSIGLAISARVVLPSSRASRTTADLWNRRLAPAATRSNVGGLLGAFAYDLSIGYALIKANAIQESERPGGEDPSQFRGKGGRS